MFFLIGRIFKIKKGVRKEGNIKIQQKSYWILAFSAKNAPKIFKRKKCGRVVGSLIKSLSNLENKNRFGTTIFIVKDPQISPLPHPCSDINILTPKNPVIPPPLWHWQNWQGVTGWVFVWVRSTTNDTNDTIFHNWQGVTGWVIGSVRATRNDTNDTNDRGWRGEYLG